MMASTFNLSQLGEAKVAILLIDTENSFSWL